MSHFFPLTVTDIRPETRHAVVVTLAPDPKDAEHFAFMPGQYLTLRHSFGGEEVRRCYSLCSKRGSDGMQIGIKHVADGVFSSWANRELKKGDVVEAMPPMGRFHAPIEREVKNLHLFFAAGSGITPILGVLRTVLAEEPLAGAILVYSNRSAHDIMFHEALEDLKNRHMGRLSVIHILTGDTQEAKLFSGRINREKLDVLFSSLIPVSLADRAFICGPESLMQLIRDSLCGHGMATEDIRYELFLGNKPGIQVLPPPVHETEKNVRVSITLDGATRIIEMPKGDQTVLEAALAAGLDAPFSCRAGVCATCQARILEGAVDMRINHALEDYEVRQGYILTCQALPVSKTLSVSYEI